MNFWTRIQINFLGEASLIILDSKTNVFMSKIQRDTDNARHIAWQVHFVRNVENWNIHKIDWCEEGPQLEYIENENVGETDLNPGIKYIMVTLDKW